MRTNSKQLWVFATASFLHDIGSDIVFSVWPFFVIGVLGANTTILGLIDGLGDAIVSISQAASGYWSDRIRKRKVFVWIGYFLGGLARIGYAFSPAWQFLIPFRMLDRSGKIRGAPRDAIISDFSTRENRGKNFGILRAMDNFGAVVGILITMAFLGILGYQTLFLFAAIPSVIATIIIFLFVKESHGSKEQIYKGIRLKDLSLNLWLFIALSAIFSLGSFSYSFLLLYAKNTGFEVGVLPGLYLLFTIVAAIFSIPFGRLADAIGRKSILFLSFLFWIAVLLSFLVSKNFIIAIFAFLFYGLHKAALEPSQKTLVAELAPKGYVASTLGGFQMIVGIASLPASLLAGLLWDRIGNMIPLMSSLGLTVVSCMLLLFVKER